MSLVSLHLNVRICSWCVSRFPPRRRLVGVPITLLHLRGRRPRRPRTLGRPWVSACTTCTSLLDRPTTDARGLPKHGSWIGHYEIFLCRANKGVRINSGRFVTTTGSLRFASGRPPGPAHQQSTHRVQKRLSVSEGSKQQAKEERCTNVAVHPYRRKSRTLPVRPCCGNAPPAAPAAGRARPTAAQLSTAVHRPPPPPRAMRDEVSPHEYSRRLKMRTVTGSLDFWMYTGGGARRCG